MYFMRDRTTLVIILEKELIDYIYDHKLIHFEYFAGRHIILLYV